MNPTVRNPRGEECLPSSVPALAQVHRVPEAGVETRQYVGLDRNERVAPFPDWFMEEIRRSVTSSLLTQYPAQDQLHLQLQDQLHLAAEQLILTPRSDAAFKALYQAYVRPGDRIVMLDPSYAMFPVYAQMFAGEAVLVPYDRNVQLDTECLLNSVTPGVRLLMLANPNQPTATLLDEEVLLEVVERAANVGALVAMDEAYYPFSDATALPWLENHPNLLVIRTFSKASGLAGLRIGFAAGHPDVIANLYKVHTVNDLNSMSVLCASLILKYPAVVDDYVSQVKAGERLLAAAVENLGLTPLPTHTNFMLIRVAHRCAPSSLVEALKSRGYLVKGPLDSPCVADCIRVTLGPPDLMSTFAESFRDAVEWCATAENGASVTPRQQ